MSWDINSVGSLRDFKCPLADELADVEEFLLQNGCMRQNSPEEKMQGERAAILTVQALLRPTLSGNMYVPIPRQRCVMKTFMPVYLASRSEGELEDEDQKRIQLNRKSIEVVGHENSVLSPLLNMPKKAKASLKMVYAPMAFLMTTARPSSMYHRFPNTDVRGSSVYGPDG